LSESYCCGPKPDLKEKTSWICAAAQDNNRIMEDISDEGSAEVTWHFGPPNKISIIASLLVKAFTKKGYIVNWNKNMGGQITAVIEIDDLPRSFLQKWFENNKEDYDQSFTDKRIDPDVDFLFNDDDEYTTHFFSNEESYEDSCEESYEESCEESCEESDNNIKTIDPSSDEESDQESDQDDTVCPKNCNCINCKEELDK
jgi:hypothetical protein